MKLFSIPILDQLVEPWDPKLDLGQTTKMQRFPSLTHQMKKEEYLKEILHANSVPTSLPAKQTLHFT
jgi:hypothetical protein